MPRAALQYTLLAMLLIAGLILRGTNSDHLIRIIEHRDAVPGEPVALAPATRTVAAGRYRGDEILAIDGRPFNAGSEIAEATARHKPGESMRLTLSQPGGAAFEQDVRIPDRAAAYTNWFAITLAFALSIFVPVVAMGLGFAVVLIRPLDWNAWLVLFLMSGFTETVAGRSYWNGPEPLPAFLWNAFWNSMWPTFMLLFGLYFPTRSLRDRRYPWVKYILIALFVTINAGYWTILLVWQSNVNAAMAQHGLFRVLTELQLICLIIANGAYFGNFRRKRKAENSPDARRRLVILQTGSWIGLGPIFLLAIYAVFTGQPLLSGIPPFITVLSLLFLPFFPLTLAYVIVVERAMDLRFVIRSGVQYGLAKTGLWVLRIIFIGAAITLVVSVRRHGGWGSIVGLSAVVTGLVVTRQSRFNRLGSWIDRKYFREAYDSEKLLADLAGEVTSYIEIKPLLERVAARVGETLHVPDIVILLLDGRIYRTAYSTRPGEPMDIPESSRIVTNLRKRGEPVEIYFDKPPLWIRSLTVEELQTLDFMRTQLLLPISGRERLTGMISLGPKLSEAPWSKTDIKLLQAVAWQAGMAIENSRLAASLAGEAADRERNNSELAIAREVQERLFPQKTPQVPGIECAGRCRAAQGVGGDYYDFLQLPDGSFGIAIGDVSGKGIAAALLMASLQAGFRGQALAGITDLTELMANVNRLVYETSAASRYATLFYGEYDPATRELSFVNAGHNPPIVVRGEDVVRLQTGGMVVGLLPGATYKEDVFSLCPGDILVGFTDGISEAQNPGEEEWGETRLIETVRAVRALEPARIIDEIFRAADRFTGSAKQYDDMTLVVMKVL